MNYDYKCGFHYLLGVLEAIAELDCKISKKTVLSMVDKAKERMKEEFNFERDMSTTTGETFFNPIWNGEGKKPELVVPLLELKKRLKNNPEFGTGELKGGEDK